MWIDSEFNACPKEIVLKKIAEILGEICVIQKKRLNLHALLYTRNARVCYMCV